MKLDRQQYNDIYADTLLALDGVAKKHGVKFSGKGWGSGRPTSFIIKIEAALENADGSVETAERAFYKQWCGNLGMKPEWLDKTFTFGGDQYQITGLRTRRCKNPVLAKNTRNGKDYVFSHFDVKMLMDLQTPKGNL